MEYSDVIAGLHSLEASDFDPMDTNARGPEKRSELTDALMSLPEPERAIPELFQVMERLADADLGSPGSLVHTLEVLKGYEAELIHSIRRSPSLLSLWMFNRILNTDLPKDVRKSYVSLLNDAAVRSDVAKTVRDDARPFVELQARKHKEIR